MLDDDGHAIQEPEWVLQERLRLSRARRESMANDPVLTAAVQRASAAVAQTANSPRNDMSGAAVAEAKVEMDANIKAAIAPVIANVTNTEAHFWQKRTFWSTLYAGVAGLVPAVNAFLEYMAGHAVDGKVTIATIIFATLAGYSAARAGIAVVPLGTQQPYPLNKG